MAKEIVVEMSNNEIEKSRHNFEKRTETKQNQQKKIQPKLCLDKWLNEKYLKNVYCFPIIVSLSAFYTKILINPEHFDKINIQKIGKLLAICSCRHF